MSPASTHRRTLALALALVAGLILGVPGPAAAQGDRQNLHSSCGDTRNNWNFRDSLHDAINNNGEGRVGPRRLVVTQSGRIASRGTRLFVQATPMDIDRAKITIEKTDGRARTTVIICATAEGSDARQTRLTEFDIPRGRDTDTFTRNLSGLRDKRVSVHFKGRSVSDTMRYRMNFTRPNAGTFWRASEEQLDRTYLPVPGFADLHVHHASRWAFGGGWYSGDIEGSAQPDPLAHARELTLNLAGVGVYTLREDHQGQTVPRWNDTSHQQLGFDQLREAHQGGLRLMLSSAVNSEWLCAMLAYGRRTDRQLSCNDMESAKQQILRMKRFDRAHEWYRIVTNPWQARDAIRRGQLAVVLGIEVSNLFPSSDGDWRRQLDEVYDMGVRSAYITHESNNRFAGTAFHHTETLKYPNMLTAWFSDEVEYASEGTGFNPQGLTSTGRDLVTELMRRNMLIDIDHLSWEAVDDLVTLSRAQEYYPLFAAHTRLSHLLTDAHRQVITELHTPYRVIEYIRESGGMVGLRAGPERMEPYAASGVPENCGGSVKSLIQTYRDFIDRGVPVAFGTDLNGFVTMTGPRFGPDACPDAPEGDRLFQQTIQVLPPVEGRPAGWDRYEQRGLSDIGTEPAAIHDMKFLGADVSHLENSAQSFLRMWTRAYSGNHRGRVPPGTPLPTPGITR